MPNREGELPRRTFIRNVGVGLGAAALLASCKQGTSQAAAPAPAAPPVTPAAAAAPAVATHGDAGAKVPIALLRHAKLATTEQTVPQDAIFACLDAGMKHVFGVTDPAKAWQQVAKPADVVAIKASCISGLIYTHPVLVAAIVQRLTGVGVVPENIIIYERDSGELSRSGFKMNRDGPGVRCYGTDGAYEDWLQHRDIRIRLTKILTQTATVLINVPIVKNHGCGITFSMKNHYGTVANPGDLHGGNCNPACAQLADVPVIQSKTRLIIGDCISGCFDQGPGGRPDTVWPCGALIVTQNMVAADAIGLELIDIERKRRGMSPMTPNAGYILSASQLGLGPNDRAHMDVLETQVG